MLGSAGHLTRRELLRLASAAGAGLAFGGALPRTAAAAPTASYDDGSTAVPGGLAGDPERVIVIGAGWAGLTAANALRNAGVDHVLLEARDRVGGRAVTADVADVPIDLGCSWIHQPHGGNPMARFADQAGVARTNADIELDAPILRFFDGYLDREVSAVERMQPYGYAFEFAQNSAGTIADELGPGASVRRGAQVYLDRWGVRGDTRRQAEFLIRGFSEMVYGHDWNELSLLHWAWGKREPTYLGVGEGDMPVGGYRRLVRAMAAQGEVRLGHRVRAVESGPRGVRVHAIARGRRVTLRGSHVLVAVPLGVLKAGAIRFDPGLPAAHRGAIARLGFGALEKVVMVYDEPFWHDLTHTHITYLSDHAPLELPMWIDLQRILGVPALFAFAGAASAREVHRLGSDGALELARTRLREILGRDVPRPRAFAVTDWQADPFCRGAYSSVLVGNSDRDMDVLADPVRGRILFAGEATNRLRHSTADGAMSSGIREAKRLLRRASVELSAG